MKKLNITQEFSLGIDVGKRELFCHLKNYESAFSETFANNPKDISRLIKWVKSIVKEMKVHTCMEATGHYTREVARAVYLELDRSLYVVNPRQVKAYANRSLRRNKSDKADAKLIAKFLISEQEDLKLYIPRTKVESEIFELSKQKESFVREIAKLKTQLQGREFKSVQAALNRAIKFLEKECEKMEQKISNLIAKDQEKTAQKELLLSVPGLAERTVNLLIAQIPPVENFSNARQLAAWIGVTPKHFESGTSGRKHTPITKMGSSSLRSGLFLPAMSAMTHNPIIKSFADRMRENDKPGKSVVIACVRKMVHLIYGILRHRIPFDPQMNQKNKQEKPLTLLT